MDLLRVRLPFAASTPPRHRSASLNRRPRTISWRPRLRSSQKACASAHNAEELQADLESLLQEAREARGRADKARARFVRLTEAVEQMSLRAAAEMRAGNEAAARQLLIDKKNVMFALEVSKRRAEVLEELSSKLSEIMSRKETSLIAELASAISIEAGCREAQDVRIVPPPETDAEARLLDDEEDYGSSSSTKLALSSAGVSFQDYITEVDGELAGTEDRLDKFLQIAAMLKQEAASDERTVLVARLLQDVRRARSRIRKFSP